MTTLQIEVPDDLKARLEAQAAAGGYGTVERYAEAVLRASAEAPDAELEQMLAGRAEDPRPGVEFTPEFADQFREQVLRRRGPGGARP